MAPASTVSGARARSTEYGIQLRAKQKLKGYYGNVTEKMFRAIYDEASPG